MIVIKLSVTKTEIKDSPGGIWNRPDPDGIERFDIDGQYLCMMSFRLGNGSQSAISIGNNGNTLFEFLLSLIYEGRHSFFLLSATN